MRVSDGVFQWAAREPGRVAIDASGRCVSYGELGRRAGEVRDEVVARLGEASSAPVSIECADRVEFLAAFFGVVAAGAIAVPWSIEWTVAEQDAAREACPPALVFRNGEWEARAAPGSGLSDGVGSGNVLDTPFYVGFSSGSTGLPKAIVRNHREWLNSFLAMSVEFGIGRESAVAVPGSLFFSFSLIAALHTLYVGGVLRLPGGPGLPAIVECAAGAEAVYMLPSVLDAVLRRCAGRGEAFNDVRQVICAGEKLQPETRRAARLVFPRAKVVEYYGASELGFVTVLDDAQAERRPGSVGRPFLGTEVAILSEGGGRLGPGEVGIIGARTGYGFAGYWGDARGTAAIEHCGWPTVGDLGWLAEDGYLYLAGRRDNMVVLKGVNVYPERIEQVLLALDGIEQVVVVPEPADRPARLVAHVVASRALEARAVIAHCAKRLAGPGRPSRVIFHDELPQTATGKVDRAAIMRGGKL